LVGAAPSYYIGSQASRAALLLSVVAG